MRRLSISQNRYAIWTSIETLSLIPLKAWDKLDLESHRGKVIIRGKEVIVELSTGKLSEGVNLLGMDVLKALGLASIDYDWAARTVRLKFHTIDPEYDGSDDAYGWTVV